MVADRLFVCLIAVLAVQLLLLCGGGCEASEEEQARYVKKGKVKPRRGKSSPSVKMTVPNSFFDESIGRDWKAPAQLDPSLVRAMDRRRGGWKDVAWAQFGEDMWLVEKYFYGMKNGVVIESGALDGADPENYRFLRINRPNAVTVNGALCSEPRLLHYSSLGVIPVRGFVEFMTPSFLKQWHGPVYNNKTKLEDLPTVQCMPMRKLLSLLGVTHVDLWILDVEGAEESALQGTDFNAVHFNVIAMECDSHDAAKNARKVALLEGHGFACEQFEINCMCKHKSFTPSSKTPQRKQ